MPILVDLTVIQPQITACHVNLNEMEPHALGTYCNSCNKVVHDLTHLSNAALIDFLSNNANENICGRVTPAAMQPMFQMAPVSETVEQRRLALFGLALVFVFGPLLFSCSEEKEKQLQEIQTIETRVAEPITEPVSRPFIEVEYGEHPNYCSCMNEEYPDEPKATDSLFAVEKDGILLEPVIIKHQVTDCGERIICSTFFGVTSLVCTVYQVEVIDSITEFAAAKESITEPIIKDLLLSVYPNPAMQDVTIAYTITEPGNAILSIFSLTGQHIVDLINTDDISVGEYTTGFNVSEIASGMYLVVLLNNNTNQVFRMAVTK